MASDEREAGSICRELVEGGEGGDKGSEAGRGGGKSSGSGEVVARANVYREGGDLWRCRYGTSRLEYDDTYFGQGTVLILELFSQRPHLLDACGEPAALLDFLLDTIEPETVLLEGGVRTGGSGRAQVILIKRDGKGRVGGEDELGGTLAPVSGVGSVNRAEIWR